MRYDFELRQTATGEIKRFPAAFVRSMLGREPHSVWMNWRIELMDGTVEN
jgi:hypothetical protein